jgi:hypothetical protein
VKQRVLYKLQYWDLCLFNTYFNTNVSLLLFMILDALTRDHHWLTHVTLLTWLINMNINTVVLTVNKCFFAVLRNTTECTTLNSDLSLYTIFHHYWYWYLIWHERDNYGTWISSADFVFFFYFNLIFSTEVLNKTVHWRRKLAFGSDLRFLLLDSEMNYFELAAGVYVLPNRSAHRLTKTVQRLPLLPFPSFSLNFESW